jgi:membrane protease YdiL (CAAX protease family)
MSDLPLTFPIEAPLVAQALDIQHDTDPAEDHGNSRRIPHLGHALLFFVIVIVCLVVSLIGVYAVAHLHSTQAIMAHPGLGLAAQALGYLLALGLSAWIFPLLWDKSFFQGVHWNGQIAIRRGRWIIAAGLCVSIVAQLSLHFVSAPQHAPLDDFLQNPHLVWYTAAFGIFLGPFMEELAFRGFLLPAIATAYDWLTFPRTPAALDRWRSASGHTTPALIVAAILSSIPFALMHAAQIGYAWGVIGILYGVSLALSYVRIRTQSLACSTLLHSTYNFIIFALLFLSTDGFRHMEKIAH